MKSCLIEASLAEVCSLVTDGTHDTPRRVPSGFPLIKAREIVSGQIDFSGCDQISEAEHRKVIARSNPEFGDTLFTHIGASLGAAAFVNTTREFSIKNIALFKPNPEIIDSRYLYYLVVSPNFQSLAIGTKTGSAQPFLGLSQLRGHRIQYHNDLDVQRRIAGILWAYDEMIENSQKRIKVLESMARALYREWFVHFRFPGHESVLRIPSSLGEIPEGWEVKKLGDLCELRKDLYKDSDHSGLPLLDMARMPSRSLATSNTGSPAELTTSRILFQKGDTLFGAIRCYLHKVVSAHFPGVTNTSVLVLRPRSPSFRSLVAIVASDFDTIRWAETQSTGTKMPVINWGVFQGMPVPIPSKTLANAFEEVAGSMLDEIGVLAAQIQNLRRTRDLLLPRLLSGQIDVEAIAT